MDRTHDSPFENLTQVRLSPRPDHSQLLCKERDFPLSYDVDDQSDDVYLDEARSNFPISTPAMSEKAKLYRSSAYNRSAILPRAVDTPSLSSMQRRINEYAAPRRNVLQVSSDARPEKQVQRAERELIGLPPASERDVSFHASSEFGSEFDWHDMDDASGKGPEDRSTSFHHIFDTSVADLACSLQHDSKRLWKKSHLYQCLGSVSIALRKKRTKVILTTEEARPYASVFRFPHFNRMQSIMFDEVFNTDNNVVVTAPTGGGKTVLFELALIKMLREDSQGKAVYLAPIKALCAERVRDWQSRFASVNCKVLEMTGDTEKWSRSDLEEARLVVATPEKWDSVTRRAAVGDPLMTRLHLFMVDEVHSVREKVRGARLEVIVARTKDQTPRARIMAVSATIPNAKDIAAWIGPRGPINGYNKPLKASVFSELFRPCPLDKYVYGYAHAFPSDQYFQFEKHLNTRLPDIIAQHSDRKATLIFCSSRKSVEVAAAALAKDVKGRKNSAALDAVWPHPEVHGDMHFLNEKLNDLSVHGIGFHHAGLDVRDKRLVEEAFLSGRLTVLCTTTTLAMGVNLPAYLVIIRGTRAFSPELQWENLNDLTVLQMMGRAGRPQYDTKGVCCIMTEEEDRKEWENLLNGQTTIESTLHLDLTEHVNAEVARRDTCRPKTVAHWLRGTFFFARMKENPNYYKLPDCERVRDENEAIDVTTHRILKILSKHELVSNYREEVASCDVKSSPYGRIMAMYFLRFETMIRLLALEPGFTIDLLVRALSEADEFKDFFFRQGEKAIYERLLSSGKVLFPPLSIASISDKVSILLQTLLAGLPITEFFREQGAERFYINPRAELNQIMQMGSKIARAALSIAVERKDGRGARAAYDLSRAIWAKSWDDSPSIFRVIKGLSDSHCRILWEAKIKSFQQLAESKSTRIQMLLNLQPRLTSGVIRDAKKIPQLLLDVQETGQERIREGLATVSLRITIDLNHTANDRKNVMTTHMGDNTLSVGLLVHMTSPTGTVCIYRKKPVLHLLSKAGVVDVKCDVRAPVDEIRVVAAVEEIGGTAVEKKVRPILGRHTLLQRSANDSSVSRASSDSSAKTRFLGTRKHSAPVGQGTASAEVEVEQQMMDRPYNVGPPNEGCNSSAAPSRGIMQKQNKRKWPTMSKNRGDTEEAGDNEHASANSYQEETLCEKYHKCARGCHHPCCPENAQVLMTESSNKKARTQNRTSVNTQILLERIQNLQRRSECIEETEREEQQEDRYATSRCNGSVTLSASQESDSEDAPLMQNLERKRNRLSGRTYEDSNLTVGQTYGTQLTREQSVKPAANFFGRSPFEQNKDGSWGH